MGNMGKQMVFLVALRFFSVFAGVEAKADTVHAGTS